MIISYKTSVKYAFLVFTNLVPYKAHNPERVDSNPTPVTTFTVSKLFFGFGYIARSALYAGFYIPRIGLLTKGLATHVACVALGYKWFARKCFAPREKQDHLLLINFNYTLRSKRCGLVMLGNLTYVSSGF